MQMRSFQFAKMQKIRDFKVFFLISGVNAPRLPNGDGLQVPETPPLGASRLPRLARDLWSFDHLPYLEIKLTFECTARFYGLALPLRILQGKGIPQILAGITTLGLAGQSGCFGCLRH